MTPALKVTAFVLVGIFVIPASQFMAGVSEGLGVVKTANPIAPLWAWFMVLLWLLMFRRNPE